MDSYSKGLHLRDKDYVPDIPKNELSSLEEGEHQESEPRFSVDEPLEVQLRFDLGSLVDAQVLLDTHGPRESHWDFMRQEQGRFQTSSEENTALLVHDKQDDLKSFDNCEGWPRSTNQMDTQLFLDAHDDVCMITEAFEGKDKSMAHPGEEDRSLLLPSYSHRREVGARWIGEDRKVLEGKAQGVDNSCREGVANGTIGASQILVERPDTRGACNSSTEVSPHPEDAQVQTNENNENQEIEKSASDLVTEPLVNLEQMKKKENQEVERSALDIEPMVNLEQTTEDKAASLTVSEPHYQVLPDASEEAKVKQELSLDSSNDNRPKSVQPDASNSDDKEVSTQKEILTENVNGQTMDSQDSPVFEEQSNMTDLAAKVHDKTISAISESIGKDNEAGHISSNAAEELQETGTALVIHSHVIFGPAMDAQDSHAFEEQSKMTALETKVDDKTISAISESLEKVNETGYIFSDGGKGMQKTGTTPDVHSHMTFGHTSPNLERETPDLIPEEAQETGTAPVIHSHVNFGHTNPNLERETPDLRTEEMQETGTAPVIHSHFIFGHTSPNLERVRPDKIPKPGGMQNTPGDSSLESESTQQTSKVTAVPDLEKQVQSGLPCSKEDFISQGSEGVTTSNISMLENSKETNLPRNENVDGMIVTTAVSLSRDSEKTDEAECKAKDSLDAQGQTTHNLPGIEQADTNLAGEKGVAAMEFSTIDQQVICLEPAVGALKQDAAEVCTASALEQDAADSCTGARRFENTSLCSNMEQEDNTQGIDSMADLSVVTPDTFLKETTAKKLSEKIQVSAVHDDSLKPSDYEMQPEDHVAEDNGNSGQQYEHRDALSNVLTVEHTSLVDESIIEKIDAKSVDERRQYGFPIVASIQELSVKHHSGDQSASSYSISSAKPNLLNGNNISAESTHPGGVLHVLLDVHKEVVSDDSVPKDQEHVERIASKTLPDVQTFDASHAARSIAGEVAVAFSDTYVSGLTGMAATSGSQEDEQLGSNYTTPPQDRVSKRKSDPATRNNRLKDSARASPLQVRSDQEQRSAGKGFGKRKPSPKNPAQKKGTEPLEIFSSPKKSGSKSASGRKKGISLPMVQDATASPVTNEVFQTPANISKSVLSVNARQHGVPDLNGSDIAVPMALPAQPFSEPQQVQLRAQILVYGSLIQGAAPEEALMIAAFSNVTGAPVRDLETSGRAVWEKQWQAAVERIHAKSSRDTSRDSRGSGVFVSSLPGTSAKASEGDLKANNSPGVANSTMDTRNVAGLHARVADIPGTKGHPSRSRHSADPGFGISVNRTNQSAAVKIGHAGPSLSTTLCSMSSPLSENLIQSSKSRVDLQQITPQTYYPAPPLGPFLTGTPQWLPTASFSGPWQQQTQTAVYNTPSTLFTHGQAIVNSDQAPEMRRNTNASSGTIAPANPIIPTLFTPVVGPLAGTPTPAADPVQKRQPVSESRPRKRKKIQSETYVAPSVPFMAGSQATTVSDLPAGQAGLVKSSPINLPSLTAPESLAMVVVNTQIPNTSQEALIVTSHANRVSAPSLTNMLDLDTPIPAVEHGLEKSVSLQNSTSQLAQAQRSAEEAASVAASAVRESESLWSRLKAQRNAGLTSDIEMQMVSSALAVATAASVAKAAAAAAKAAYEAAVQAKMISEDALGGGKHGDESESFRLLQNKADNASQTWGMPESCYSIMASAKMASKKRLEAISAARVRAQNFDSVVRAAELASYAVTQVGSVMAMGESVPFNLEMLMEAGPEGFHKLLSLGTSEDKDETMAKGTGPQSPGKKGTLKQKGSIEKNKHPSKRSISGIKEASVQNEAQVDSQTTDSVILARSENDAMMNADSGVGLMTEFNNPKINDQLGVYMQVCRQGLPPSRTEDELTMQAEDSIIDNQIMKGSPVEVTSDEKGLRGVWFSARVQNVDGGKVFVLYDDLLSDDGFSPLEEWIQLKGSSSKAPRVRLAHPNKNIGFEGTRKRRREAMGSHKWSVGDRVDAWMRDGWWEGEIKEVIEDGDSKAKVFFPGDGDTSLVKTSKLRPSLVWSNGHWVLWTDAKQEKNEPSRGRSDPHEGETPIAKRQKTEKGQASNASKQKLVGSNIAEIAATQKEGSLLDSAAVKLPTDFKSFAVGGIDKPKSQGSKVVFGVPRPTKKRKLIEVSKHYSSARGARNTNTSNVKAISNKHEEAMNAVLGFVTGSSELSRLDGLKTKKRVLPSPKAKVQKGADSERAHSKVNVIRNKREKPFVDTKALARKNPSSREGLPSVPKNKEGKVISKKKQASDKSQPGSQKQPEGFPGGDVLLQKLSAASGATSSEVIKNTSIIQEEGKKEPSHAAERTGKSSEKQTAHAVKETGREPSHMVQASDSKQTSFHSVKEREKQPFQQLNDGEKQPSNPGNGNRHSSKKKETHPSVPAEGNEERASQKHSLAQEKESGSQSVQEGERQLLSAEASREKQPASPVNEIEKHPPPLSKETDKGKDVGKSGSETWEPRRTSRKIQPTSKLLEGLQTAPKLGKNSSSHDKGSRVTSKAPPHV